MHESLIESLISLKKQLKNECNFFYLEYRSKKNFFCAKLVESKQWKIFFSKSFFNAWKDKSKYYNILVENFDDKECKFNYKKMLINFEFTFKKSVIKAPCYLK